MRFEAAAVSCLLFTVFAPLASPQTLEVGDRGAITIEIDRIDAQVEEGVARIVVDETFRNTTATVLEGTYRFKLPADAVIGAFSMWMEGKERQGRVLEAKEARATYDAIVRKKRDPGLLEQTGWRDFRVNVYPIPALETVRVKLVYSHLVRDDLGLETLEIPLPQRHGAIGDLRIHVVVAGSQLPTGLDCPSHQNAQLTVSDAGAEANVGGDGVVPAGPFILRALPRKGDGEFGVTLLADRVAGSERGCFIARIVPRLTEPTPIARDLVFVVDRSGSMQGKKIEQARAALLAGLDSLRPGDRFDVVSFSTDVTSLGAGRLLEANPENLASARRAAKEIDASGGTNIRDALLAAVRGRNLEKEGAAANADGRLFAVVFLTDGDPTVGVTDPALILSTWHERSAGARLFAFGVGNDVKDFLLTKLATEGRGEARYVREDENLEVPLAALFDRVKTPLLLDPVVDVEGDGVEIVDREPRRLPDLFQGRTLVVAGRFKGSGKALLHLRGRAGEREVKVDVPVEFPAATAARPHVDQIWAKARVERLLDDMRALGANGEIQKEILRLGLDHQLVTPYTSFLVVENDVKFAQADEGSAFDRTPGPSAGQSNGQNSGNTSTAGSAGALTGRMKKSGAGDTTPPGDPGGPGTGGPRGPQTGGVRGSSGLTGRRNSTECFESFEFWWVYNAEAFLSSGSNVTQKHPADHEVRSALLPALLDAVASPDADIAGAAALALARIVPADEADPKQLDALIAALGHPQESVRRSATLALGVLGRPEAVGPLRALLDDTAEGCKLTNATDHVEPSVRALAAASLGLLHAAPAIDELFAASHRAAGSDGNVQAMALLALGMMTERQEEIAKLLLTVIEDATVPFPVRAQAPIALAKLAGGSSAGAAVAHGLLSKQLVPYFQDNHVVVDVVRSLAIALGSIATVEDGDALDALIGAVHDGQDDQTRHFSMIALAQIGARDAAPADHAAAHVKLRDLFLVELTAPKRITHEPFGALGFAIYARNPALAPTTKREAVDALRAAFKQTTNPSYAGAMALGLGMLGARDAADELWQRYVDANDASLKGHVAVALGMMGTTSHAAELRSSIVKKNLESNFRQALGRALGLLSDSGAAPALIDLLEDGNTLADSSAAAQALARIGGADSIAPLLAIAKDPTTSPRQRGLAIGALGRMAEKTSRPWRAVFSIDSNYRAMAPAVSEILDQF